MTTSIDLTWCVVSPDELEHVAPYLHRDDIARAVKQVAELNERSAEQVLIVELQRRLSVAEAKLAERESPRECNDQGCPAHYADREQVPAVAVPDSVISSIEFALDAICNETVTLVCCGRPGQECCGEPDVDWPSWATEATTKLASAREFLLAASQSHSQQSAGGINV